MNSSVQPTAGQVHDPALAFKRVMARSILESAIPKKVIAIDLGVTQSALSHWLSEETTFTIPGHLIPGFCRLVGDDALLWHLQAQFGGVR